MNVKPLLALTASFLWLLPVEVIADADPSNGEQRCDDLGANCICAEALNTDFLGGPWNGFWYNPSDSTSKECTMEGSTGNTIETRTPTVFSDATALAALPAGHSINYFIGGLDGGNGIFKIGQKDIGGARYVKRVAVRFYVYYTSDYEFAGDGVCENAKLMHVDGVNIDHTDGQIKQANFLAKTHTYNGGVNTVGDCCMNGPPGDTGVVGFTNTTKAKLRGDWHRYEFVITNRAGGLSPNGIRYEMFWKNITENTPEVQIIDTFEPCPNCGPDNSWLGADDLTPSERVDEIWVNFYRQNTCNGWKAASHLLYAGWDSDEGQRIGSAKEIEGMAGEIESIRPNPPVILQ